MSRTNTSRCALLGILARNPMSGYDIKKFVEEGIAHFWSESYGQIYPMLKRLDSEGLALGRRARHREGRDRQVYALTRNGLAELKRWLKSPTRFEAPRSELLLKMFFGRHVAASELAHHVRQFRDRYVQLLHAYGAIAKRLQKENPRDRELPYWLMTLNFGRYRCEAFLRWSDETLRELALMEKPKERRAGRKR